MRLGVLRAIAHNIADSLGSGVGLLIGVYELDIFGEAKRSPGGAISVDFLRAKVVRGKASRGLTAAITKYREALPTLCAKHGASIEDFKTLTVSYSTDMFDRRIVVRIRDRVGRCYVDEYVGTPARHIRVTDRLGRIRTKRGQALRLSVVAGRSDYLPKDR